MKISKKEFIKTLRRQGKVSGLYMIDSRDNRRLPRGIGSLSIVLGTHN
jgi:hypothetical protein